MSSPAFLGRASFAAGALLILILAAVGCGGGGGGGGAKIAYLLPENETARYEAHDRPEFEENVEEECEDCEILYNNATEDASKQQSQAEAALTQGAEVMVLDPVDAKSAAAIVEKAKAQDVPVLSYDRLTENAEVDYYVSFDNERVGDTAGRIAGEKTERRRCGERSDRDDQRRPRRQQRRPLQKRRAKRIRKSGC